MSRILIVYGTTDGHTRKIAEALGETFRREECRVDVIDASEAGPYVRPADYDGVVVAASVHIGAYQRAVKRWVQLHSAELNRTPSAFVSVCLAVLEKRREARQEVEKIRTRFLQRSGWRPTVSKTVAGALLYTRYNWLKRWVIKRIVAKAGGDTDTTRDFEYTDWSGLRAFGRVFARHVAAGRDAALEIGTLAGSTGGSR